MQSLIIPIASLVFMISSSGDTPQLPELRITPETTKVLEPGPIVIRVELRNPFSKPIDVYPRLGFWEAVRYEFVLDSERYFISDGVISCLAGNPPLSLPPHGALVQNLVIFGSTSIHGKGEPFLPFRSGAELRIRASSKANGSVEAITAPIKVRARDRSEEEAFSFWSDLGEFGMAVGSGVLKCERPNCSKELDGRVETFLQRNPNEPSGAVLASGLASGYHGQFINTRGRPGSRLTLEKSQHWYQWILDHHPESFLAPEAAFRLAELANADNDLDEAQRAIALVEQRFLDGLDWESRLQFESIKRGVKYKLTPPDKRPKEQEAPPGPEIFVRGAR